MFVNTAVYQCINEYYRLNYNIYFVRLTVLVEYIANTSSWNHLIHSTCGVEDVEDVDDEDCVDQDCVEDTSSWA